MISPAPAEHNTGTKYKKEILERYSGQKSRKELRQRITTKNYNKELQQRKNGRPHLPRPSVFSLLLFVLFVFFRFLSFAVFSGGIQLALIIALDHFQVLDKDGAGFRILTDTDTLVAVDDDLYLVHVVQTGQ